jgi:hypothetical protein
MKILIEEEEHHREADERNEVIEVRKEYAEREGKIRFEME